MQNLITMGRIYSIKLENFEGPLDLLCHLIDKNKMNINDIKLSEITDQYIEYINKMEEMNLEVTSEFLVMASTLIYLKSKSLLPSDNEESEEISEEELLRRIIEYKKFKEMSKVFKENYAIFSNRFYRGQEEIKLPKQKLEKEYSSELLYKNYKRLIEKREARINKNAENNVIQPQEETTDEQMRTALVTLYYVNKETKELTPEGRMITKNYLLALERGIGKEEKPLYPITIFKVKEGINYNKNDPNYDLLKLACKVDSEKQLIEFSFLDAEFNKTGYIASDKDSEIAYMGNSIRVYENVVDKSKPTSIGRGNLSTVTINLPRLGLRFGKIRN